MGKHYAVANGRNKGVYSSWDECKQQVNGFKGAKFKSFASKQEAEQFARGGASNTASSSYSGSSRVHNRSETPYSRPRSTGGYPRSYSGTSSRSSGTSSKRSGVPQEAPEGTTVVYTDGSALGNGKHHAKAGWGVYWGQGDSRNAYGKVDSGEQTNNRGELMAIREAVQQIDRDRFVSDNSKFEIRADSQYAIDSITKWSKSWEKNGWVTSTGSPVLNRDLIEPIKSSISNLRSDGIDVSFSYVKGHAGHEGNTAADELARKGASH